MFELFLGVDIGSHLCCVGLLSFGCCCPVWVLGKCGGRGLVDWWVIQTGEDGVGGKVEGTVIKRETLRPLREAASPKMKVWWEEQLM